MKTKKLLLIPTVLLMASCGPTSNPTSVPTTAPTEEPTSAPTSEEPPVKKIDVIVMAGQSNMEGHSWSNILKEKVGEEKYQEYYNGYDDIQISYKVGCYGNNNNSNEKFRKVRIGQGCSVGQFGPELGLAEYLVENKDKVENEVALVKFAVGATSIYKEWRSPTSVTDKNDKGYLYTPFINYVAKAIGVLEEEGYEPTIKAICWMQGETDGTTFASEYYTLEDNFINDVQTDLADYGGGETIKFVDAGIYNASWVSNWATINMAKKKNAMKDEDNRFYFDTIDACLEFRNEPEANPDLAHWDSESMITLGKLFAEVLVENEII